MAFKNIYNVLNGNDLLYKYQSGFLPNHSTTFQLIDIYITFVKPLIIISFHVWFSVTCLRLLIESGIRD